MFDAEIEKANKNNDTERAAMLTANKKTFQDAIAAEQARRKSK
jgi:hypothetical protein